MIYRDICDKLSNNLLNKNPKLFFVLNQSDSKTEKSLFFYNSLTSKPHYHNSCRP